MRSRALREILERVVAQNEPRVLRAQPDPCHPRITIRISEIDLSADKNVLIVRATGGEDQRGDNHDLNCEQEAAHASSQMRERHSATSKYS